MEKMKTVQVETDNYFSNSRKIKFVNPNVEAPYLNISGKRIWVKSNLAPRDDGSFIVALWERSELHPGGEIFIGDDKPHEAAQTKRVCELVIEKILVVVDDAEAQIFLTEKLGAEAAGKRQVTAREAEQVEFFKKYHLAFGHRIGAREAWAQIEKSENSGDPDLARNALQSIGRDKMAKEKRAA